MKASPIGTTGLVLAKSEEKTGRYSAEAQTEG
jgi:hypothetical protein